MDVYAVWVYKKGFNPKFLIIKKRNHEILSVDDSKQDSGSMDGANNANLDKENFDILQNSLLCSHPWPNMNEQCTKWKKNNYAIMHWNQSYIFFRCWEIWSKTRASFFLLFYHTVYSCIPCHKHAMVISTCDLGSTRVGWKVHRLTMMQWLNLTKCGLFLNIVSPAVHTLLPSVLQRLESRGIEALILILGKSPQLQIIMTSSSIRYCFSAKCFSC